MKKKSLILIGFLLIVVGLLIFVKSVIDKKESVLQSPVLSEPIKEKKKSIVQKVFQEQYSEEAAKKFVIQYQELNKKEKFEEMYKLLCLGDKEIVSKEVFVQKNRESVKNQEMPAPEIEITNVELKTETKQAVIYVSLDTILGMLKEQDTIGYIDGKWCQKLDHYSFYGIPVSMDPNIKKFKAGETVILPGLEIRVISVKENSLFEREYDREIPKGKFVFVTAEIKNTGKQTYKGYMTRYKLIDNQDREYEDKSFYDSLTGPTEIAPGFSESGDIIFDIPKESKPSELLIQTEGDNQYLIDLSVL